MAGSKWEPISEASLAEDVESAVASMEPEVECFWRRIRIRPEKWQLSPWGDTGGGFWVVAIIGQQCIWYNDIEDGFNVGSFAKFGFIRDYLCDQNDLDCCVRWYFAQFMQELKQVGVHRQE